MFCKQMMVKACYEANLPLPNSQNLVVAGRVIPWLLTKSKKAFGRTRPQGKGPPSDHAFFIHSFFMNGIGWPGCGRRWRNSRQE